MVNKPPGKYTKPGTFIRRDHWQREQVVPDRRFHQVESIPNLVPLLDLNDLVALYQKIPASLHGYYNYLKAQMFHRKLVLPWTPYCLLKHKRPIALCEFIGPPELQVVKITTSAIDERNKEKNLINLMSALIAKANSVQNDLEFIVYTNDKTGKCTNDLLQLGFESIGLDKDSDAWKWRKQ